MARSSETFGKKEKEKKKAQKRKEKEAKKLARKEAAENADTGLDAMMAYVDEDGVITDTPPDPNKKRKVIKAENIQLGYKKEDMPDVDPIHEGKVSFFNDEKGYGFIKDKDSQDSYFVHINNARDPIAEGDKVQFELEPGQKGMAAVKVKKIEVYTPAYVPPAEDDEDEDEEETETTEASTDGAKDDVVEGSSDEKEKDASSEEE